MFKNSPWWGKGVRPVVDGLLHVLPPEPVVASRGGGGAVPGQVLGGGQPGVGDHVAQDRAAEIVPGGGRQVGFRDPLPQDAVQRLGGQVAVQPLQVAAVGDEAEQRTGRGAAQQQPARQVAGGIAGEPGRHRPLLVALADDADEIGRPLSVGRGDILHGQAGDLVDARPQLPGQGDHRPVAQARRAVILQAGLQERVELRHRDIATRFDARRPAAARGFGHQAALGGLEDGLALLGRQQGPQAGVVQQQVADAVDVPADGSPHPGDVGGGVFLSRQVFQVFLDQGFIDGRFAAPAVEAQHVAAVGALGERRAQGRRRGELLVEQPGEVRHQAVQEAVALVDQDDLGVFPVHGAILPPKVTKV
jgi:hypothetical protein